MRTFWTAGRSRPTSTPMMAITTSSSISVKAWRLRDMGMTLRKRETNQKIRARRRELYDSPNSNQIPDGRPFSSGYCHPSPGALSRQQFFRGAKKQGNAKTGADRGSRRGAEGAALVPGRPLQVPALAVVGRQQRVGLFQARVDGRRHRQRLHGLRDVAEGPLAVGQELPIVRDTAQAHQLPQGGHRLGEAPLLRTRLRVKGQNGAPVLWSELVGTGAVEVGPNQLG